jgi:hypothetical protein
MEVMRTTNDCGPVAVANATGSPLATVLDRWPTPFRGNDDDSPLHHKGVLAKMGTPWRIVNCGQILQGECPNEKTVILLHALDNPDTWMPEDLLNQHWVTLKEIDSQGRICVHNGKGGVWPFPPIAFNKVYAGRRGIGPHCAYVVGQGEVPRLSLWERLYLWATSLV